MAEQLTLEQLNARASEAARASAAVADSVIVRVNCAGETKKIELATNATVRDAIETCRRKFKFIESSGFQLYLAFPADVQLKDSELLARYKLRFNDELDFKLPKAMSPPVSGSVPARAFTQTYSTEARPAPAVDSGPGTLTKASSISHMSKAVPGSASASAVASPTLQRMDSDVVKRKLELALAEIITLRQERDRAVADCSNAQLLLLAEKEKTEKLLSVVRVNKATADAAALGASPPPPPVTAGNGAEVAALQAEVARLRAELDTKIQVIAEQQQALDEYCKEEAEAATAAAAAVVVPPGDSVEVERLRAQLAATEHDHRQVAERAAALEERLAKMVSVVSVLMEQNRQLKSMK
jgi:uncharacterized small protein (DUF1192 family)